MTSFSPLARGHKGRSPESGGADEAGAHLDHDLVELLALLHVNGDTAAASAADEQQHLTRCDECCGAVDARIAALETDRLAVAATVDDQLTDDALALQRQSILDRLVARRDGGRVLDFPARPVRTPRRDRPAVRWLAAAAAAGLFVGMLTGQRLQPMFGAPLFGRGHETSSRLGSRMPVWNTNGSGESDARGPHAHDEVFLSEMETAVNNRGAAQLRALDDLTPEPVTASVRSTR